MARVEDLAILDGDALDEVEKKYAGRQSSEPPTVRPEPDPNEDAAEASGATPVVARYDPEKERASREPTFPELDLDHLRIRSVRDELSPSKRALFDVVAANFAPIVRKYAVAAVRAARRGERVPTVGEAVGRELAETLALFSRGDHH